MAAVGRFDRSRSIDRIDRFDRFGMNFDFRLKIQNAKIPAVASFAVEIFSKKIRPVACFAATFFFEKNSRYTGWDGHLGHLVFNKPTTPFEKN